MSAPFAGVFNGLRVLVTGHTGFKGSWLCQWLLNQGATISGIALEPVSRPNLFEILQLTRRIDHHLADVRDAPRIQEIMDLVRPAVVFHLAAQSLVRPSYRDPKATWDVNVGGTVNVLEAIRATPSVRACVVVTSDKCYDNRECHRGYREDDALGGRDPYSASKGATELVAASYRASFFTAQDGCRLATARAGNVIGGGDWAVDRIVTDFVASLRAGEPLRLRHPLATRPWQHVLEPLSGYLSLAARLLSDQAGEFTGPWNFGPGDDATTTVAELARQLVRAWGSGSVVCDPQESGMHEAGLLRLDCSKARSQLGWHGVWGLDATIARTCTWYLSHANGDDVRALTDQQIASYVGDARAVRLKWAG